MQTDTIHALATGPGTAAIAVIRLSGPTAHDTLRRLVGEMPAMRRASVRRLVHDGETLDEALVIAFEPGASYTGEAMVELHCHGGRAVVGSVLEALATLGCRAALPGEFTRRAVLAGRMDLIEAEGLGDLVAAETAAQHRQALKTMQGGLSARIEQWRKRLTEARALLEVTIDWVDEEAPQDVTPEVVALLDPIIDAMAGQLARAGAAERLRVGYEVAILGAPNVGKSSLLNAIAGRESAIVADTPGTTRDVLEVRCDINGLPVTFLDTAGLRDTTDAIEAEGVRRARARAETADLRVLLRSVDTEAGAERPENCEMTAWTKADLAPGPGDLRVSVRTGQGIDALLAAIFSHLAERSSEAGLLSHHRQVEMVREAHGLAQKCRQRLGLDDMETLAEDLRQAVAALDRLVGRTGTEDMLDVVFSRFCLGK